MKTTLQNATLNDLERTIKALDALTNTEKSRAEPRWGAVYQGEKEWLMTKNPLTYSDKELLGALQALGILKYEEQKTDQGTYATLNFVKLDRLETLAYGAAGPRTTVQVKGLHLDKEQDAALKEHCDWLNMLNHAESTHISASHMLDQRQPGAHYTHIPQGIKIVRADKDNVLSLLAEHLKAYFPEAADKILLGEKKFQPTQERPDNLYTSNTLEIKDAGVAAQLVQHGLKVTGYVDRSGSKGRK